MLDPSERTRSGKISPMDKPLSLRSRMMRHAATVDGEYAMTKGRNIGSVASDDTNKHAVKHAETMNSKNSSYKMSSGPSLGLNVPSTTKDKDQHYKSSLKEKRSAATLKPDKSSLMSKSSKTGIAANL